MPSNENTSSAVRAAIYARYSSDLQNPASIADQIRVCRAEVERRGGEVVAVYDDAAISGASALRPGYQSMLQDARDGRFDVVVAESLDRLSRDQEDIAALYKRMRFAGISILTLDDGEITDMHVGLKGTMNAMQLKVIADKTRRGLRGRVEAGASGGASPTATTWSATAGPTGCRSGASDGSTRARPKSCGGFTRRMRQGARHVGSPMT